MNTVERILTHWAMQVLLASLIVVSVLPIPALRDLDTAFLLIFGAEITLRAIILKRSKRLSRGEKAILAADLLAIISFLPFLDTVVDTRVLRLIRLVRLIVLVRFLRTVVRDLRRILAQRQIRYQLGFLAAAVLLFTFLGAIVLATFDVAVEDFDGDGRPETGTLPQLLWWVFQQIEDPGNLVASPNEDWLLIAVSLVLTIIGVFVMSFIIGIGSSVVGDLMGAGRHRPVSLQDHTVVVGGGRNVREVLEDLLQMYDKNRRKIRVAVLDAPEEPPPYLEEPTFRGVEYRSGEPSSVDAHKLLATSKARRVIVLNDDELGQSSDAYAVGSVLAIRNQNEHCPIIVEMRHRRYMDVVQVAGGENVNPVPMGKFLGGLVSHNIMFPGIDAVFEELLTARGSEIYSHIYSKPELAHLRVAKGDSIDFRTLVTSQYEARGIIILGVFLGRDIWTDDVGKLTLWINPLDEPHERARALGCKKGRVPFAALRGFVAIAPEYSTVRKAATKISSFPEKVVAPIEDAEPLRQISISLAEDMCSLSRVLVLGENELLPAMLENAAEFVPNLEFLVVAASKQRARSVRDELRHRGSGRTELKPDEQTFPLARGGTATVYGARGDLLADAMDHPFVTDGPIDVIVVLADPQEADPDALSALMLLRLLEYVRDELIQVGPRFRMVSEAISAAKGDRLESRVARSGVPVRVVSTQQMRAYFLVDAAYMPGVERVHLELLSPFEQDFCQLGMTQEDNDEPMSFADLVRTLTQCDPPVIPFGLTLAKDHPRAGLTLNPKPIENGLVFRPSQVLSVYAVGETERIDGSEATCEQS